MINQIPKVSVLTGVNDTRIMLLEKSRTIVVACFPVLTRWLRLLYSSSFAIQLQDRTVVSLPLSCFLSPNLSLLNVALTVMLDASIFSY